MRGDLEYLEEVQKAEVKFRSEKRNIKDEHAQFSESIPATYDRYLGPMSFQPYAEDLAARSLRHSAQRQSIIDVYTRMMIGTGP